MVITDVHLSGGDPTMEFHLVDPASDIMDLTAPAIVNFLRSAAGGMTVDIDAYPPYDTDPVVMEIASMDNVDTAECTVDECEDWGVTRMIISNKVGTDFWLCGVAIMGYPITCPPTTEQCAHARLLPLPVAPLDMDIPVGGS
jgi:hypothetical protein